MSKCNIRCDALAVENTRAWTVTPEGRVWPCCHFSNAWDKRHMMRSDEVGEHPTEEDFNHVNDESATLLNDERMTTIMNANPNWNMLSHHAFEEIIAHEVCQSYIFYPGWQSDSPPPLCSKNCTIK